MAMAACAALVGVRPLPCEASVVPGHIRARSHAAAAECKSVGFGVRRTSCGSSFSLHCRTADRAVVPSCSSCKVVRAIAADKAVETVEPFTFSAPQQTQYHFLVANAQFMLDGEEHFQELMRERARYFSEKERDHDFWLVIEPSWLTKFPDIEKRLKRPAVALVSTDANWITFMKLRLDRVLKGAFDTTSVEDALSGNPDVELKFKKPENWVAPYAKYEGSWWTPFLLTKSE